MPRSLIFSGQVVLGKTIFIWTHTISCTYLTFSPYELEYPSSKDTMCQVFFFFIKLAKWFWRKRWNCFKKSLQYWCWRQWMNFFQKSSLSLGLRQAKNEGAKIKNERKKKHPWKVCYKFTNNSDFNSTFPINVF